MKHSYIGLVALAAMVLAGCGGGSDNGSGSGGTQSSPVSLNEVTGFLLGSDNEREIELKSGDNDGPGGSTLRCTPATGSSGCTLTISRAASGGPITARATGGTVRVTRPRQQQPSGQAPNTVTQEEANQRENTARQEGVQEGVQVGRAQVELEQRAPKWRDALKVDSFRTTTTRNGQIEVKHTRAGGRTVAPRGGRFKGDLANVMSIPGGSAWRSAGFTNSVEDFATSEERVYLYTNIERPNTRRFWKVHGETVASGNFLNDENELEEIAIVRSSTEPKFINSGTSVTSGDFSRITISGSYDGVSGTFICAACSGTGSGEPDDADDNTTIVASDHTQIVKTDDGWTFPSGTWTFEPSSVTTNVQRDQDEAYLYFGFWEKEPEGVGDDDNHEVSWIRGGGAMGGATPVTAANFNALRGERLKFQGGAVGRYAIDGIGLKPDTDIFTAKVELVATFAAADSTVSGSITDFHVKGEKMRSAEWGLSLRGIAGDSEASERSGFNEEGVAANAAVVGRIGGIRVEGIWDAELYGVANMGVETSLNSGDSDHHNTNGPSGVTCPDPGCAADIAGFAGHFNARNPGTGEAAGNTAAIGGAFAAAR